MPDSTIDISAAEGVQGIEAYGSIGDFGDFIPLIVEIEEMHRGASEKKKMEAALELEKGQAIVERLNNTIGVLNYGSTEEGFTDKEELAKLKNIVEKDLSPYEVTYTRSGFEQLFTERKEGDSLPNLSKEHLYFLSEIGIFPDKVPDEKQMASLLHFASAPENGQFKELLQGCGILKENALHGMLPILKQIGLLKTDLTEEKIAQFQKMFENLSLSEKMKLEEEGFSIENVTEKQIDTLIVLSQKEGHEELRSFAKELYDEGILFFEEKLSRRELERVLHHSNSTLKQQEAMNSRSTQKIQSLESESDKIYQALMAVVKKLDDILMKIASRIGGR